MHEIDTESKRDMSSVLMEIARQLKIANRLKVLELTSAPGRVPQSDLDYAMDVY